jgi:hypothetical protein
MLLPTPLAVKGLRSLHPPDCLCRLPYAKRKLSQWPPTTFPRFRRRKILQLYLTLPAINTPLSLGAVPKTTAPLANFQLHAHFHDCFSIAAFVPADCV